LSAAAAAPLWRAPKSGSRRFDVLGIGQNALDRICSVSGALAPGEKRALPEYAERPGGQVATAVLTCARLGLRSAYIGRVGDDSAAETVLAPLREAGVDLAGVETVAGCPTQTGVILVDPANGERTILWHRAAGLHFTAASLSRAPIADARALLLDAGDPEAAAWAAGAARRGGVPVILDADRFDPALEPLLAQVDFPIVSQQFVETFSGDGSPRETLGFLRRAGARLAAVTLGERGVTAAFGDEVIEIPAPPVAALDTTGAGDVFHGAFAWALLEGARPAEVLRAAVAAAAMNCRAAGAQGGIPQRATLEAFVSSHRPADKPED